MVPVQTSAMFRPLEAQMEGSPSPNDPSAHLANLMHAGQQSMKQFEDALAAAMGVPRQACDSDGAGIFALCVHIGYAA
jgi:polyhydroxyalkanoate synthase